MTRESEVSLHKRNSIIQVDAATKEEIEQVQSRFVTKQHSTL